MSRPWRIAGAVAAVLVLAGVAAPLLVPLDVYRPAVERAASREIGREVHLRGPLRFTLLPEPGVSAKDVVVANPLGMLEPDFAEAADLVLGAKFWPLLSGQLDVTDLVLDKPVIHLEIAKDGKPNWNMASADDTAKAEDPGETAARFAVKTLAINDGQLTYVDAATGRRFSLSQIQLSVNAEPASVKGSVVYNGQQLRLEGNVHDSTTATGTISSPLFNAMVSAGFRDAGKLAGTIDIRADSLAKALAWVGHDIGFGDQPFAMRANFENDGDRLTLTGTKLSLGAATLTGDLFLDRSAPLPKLGGSVTLEGLDTRSPGPMKDKNAGGANERDAPIDVAVLRSAAADLRIALHRFVSDGLKIENATLLVKLDGGVLSAGIADLSLYGGTGKASFSIDARSGEPLFRHVIRVTNVQARPLLSDLIGSDRVDGLAAFDLDLTAHGDTRRAIWSSLGGKASVSLNNGTVKGVDLAAISHLVQDIVTTEILNVIGDREQTKFATMKATFTIQNGVARTRDFMLTNSVLAIAGQGEVDLVRHTIDASLQPQATPALPIPDIGIPFRIYGPWDKPRYGADMKNLAKGLAQGLIKQPFNTLSNPGKALKSILGLGR